MSFSCTITDAPSSVPADETFTVYVRVQGAPRKSVTVVLSENDEVLDTKRPRAASDGVAHARCKASLKGDPGGSTRLATLTVTASSGGQEALPDAQSVEVRS